MQQVHARLTQISSVVMVTRKVASFALELSGFLSTFAHGVLSEYCFWYTLVS